MIPMHTLLRPSFHSNAFVTKLIVASIWIFSTVWWLFQYHWIFMSPAPAWAHSAFIYSATHVRGDWSPENTCKDLDQYELHCGTVLWQVQPGKAHINPAHLSSLIKAFAVNLRLLSIKETVTGKFYLHIFGTPKKGFLLMWLIYARIFWRFVTIPWTF